MCSGFLQFRFVYFLQLIMSGKKTSKTIFFFKFAILVIFKNLRNPYVSTSPTGLRIAKYFRFSFQTTVACCILHIVWHYHFEGAPFQPL